MKALLKFGVVLAGYVAAVLAADEAVLAVRASEKGLCFYCRVPDETPDAVTHNAKNE